ncbi:Polarized growth protein rax2 [Ceratocystis fimbriata CBS 114723]|uniref:Polarized growth protein rax2 n=1 Tax=Ceratocystis fimbriata CBS 114723 TaxID=1035309 RepID=A0A2C5X485_9PEZI|nr:Polarized growth protein rax2 [Ceratocystis fimbriata CBS 114723]
MSWSRRSHRSRALAMTTPTSLLSLASILSLASALEFSAVTQPNIDFSLLGRVGIAGDFSGISVYEYVGQNERPYSTNGSESIMAQLPNGVFTSLSTVDAVVRSMCQLSGSRSVMLGGDFTSLDGNKTHGLAIFDPSSGSITALDGLDGRVNSLLCEDDGVVYIGGNFKTNESMNALTWTNSSGFKNFEFAGFNGPVNSIVRSSNDHIIFGGAFTGLGNASLPTQLDGQAINLSTANITAESTTSNSEFSDPTSIVCRTNDSTSGGWLLEDNTAGFWKAELGYTFRPTKLRLWNANANGRGTKTWRFTALPLNGILNMTYVDSSTGLNVSCTSECPLSNNASQTYQDFHFVNTVAFNAFRIDISEWYGSGGGLNGVQLFQDDITAYAIDDFNEPTCLIPSNTVSRSSTSGIWTSVSSGQSDSDYLSTSLNGTISSSDASVTFYPDIRETGNYTVNIYTPGCIQDNTCSTRGQVNITGIMTSDGETSFSTSLYQTNNYDKYDQIYFGYVDASRSDFRPSVTITPLDGQSVDTQTFVAQRVGFILINSTGGLNGLYDFNPNASAFDTSGFESSAINKLGSDFGIGSEVTSLDISGDTLFVSGNFSTSSAKNIVAIDVVSNNITNLNGGLDGSIAATHIEGSLLYAGGKFNSTTNSASNLSNIAVFDIESQTWSALGAGVNGPVSYVVPMDINVMNRTTERVIAFTGSFNQCIAFDNYLATEADGLAVWVPSARNWIQNLEGFPLYNGFISASVNNVSDVGSLVAGSVTSSSLGAPGAVTLTDGTLGTFAVHVLNNTGGSASNSSLSKRANLENLKSSGVLAGTFFSSSNRNLSIFAGHFTAVSPNGSYVENLAMIDSENNDSMTGLGSGVDNSSVFSAVAVTDRLLLAGGRITGNVGGSDIGGLISYDLSIGEFTPNQPPPLTGTNMTVNSISVRPDSSQIFVGGSFSLAGSLPCPGVCIWDSEASQWNQPGITLKGEVSSMLWNSDNTLIVGGSLQVNETTSTSLAIYNAKSIAWDVFADSDTILPGPVSLMTAGSNDVSQIWVAGYSSSDGSIFLMKWTGEQWLSTAPTDMESGSVITSLQVFATTTKHESSETLEEKQVLVITGSINLRNFGPVSAVVFDGTGFDPYLLSLASGNNRGSISGIFVQNDSFFESNGGHMRLVFVVLIGMAISLGLILFIVAGGMLLDHIRKKREGYTPAPTAMFDRGSGLQRVPPQQLLEFLERGASTGPRA